MTDKEVKKLKRAELLEMLIEQTEENERLRAKISALEGQLSQRQIILEESGSIAEASLRLSNVFAEAQSAADQYLESIRKKNEALESKIAQRIQDTEAHCALVEKEIRSRCEKLIQDTRKTCAEEERATREKCEQMRLQAQQAAPVRASEPEIPPIDIPDPVLEESPLDQSLKRNWPFGRK